MDNDGSLLERLRQQLADLESSQRRRGGAATAGFWSMPSPDAAEPALSDAVEPGPRPAPGAASAGASRPSREFPEPLTIHWGNCSRVS
ncbi:MAG: hypothetical protein L0H96_08765, partial [Humibacillus sp.]|nr:hypothetical protein [Humibacillus sp.]MDN5776987.1 hypothetical protein [Humibacillus sp.]